MVELTGKVFGRLTVIRKTEVRIRNNIGWLCLCECGTEKVIAGIYLRKGTQSCGCLASELSSKRMKKTATKHGGAHTLLYYIWRGLKHRCDNPKNRMYKYYGGKGVTIYNDWYDFNKFRDWALSSGYKKGLTIDRIKSNSNYYPENCRWITQSENTRWAHAKAVKCVETGEVFKSAVEASKFINSYDGSDIGKAIRRNGRAGGYHWEYV